MSAAECLAYASDRAQAFRREETESRHDPKHAADCRRSAMVLEQLVRELEELISYRAIA